MKPDLLFGTGLSAAKEGEELYGLVRTCVENGITAFDTAPSYRTEKILGAALNRCIAEGLTDRESLFVQSKIDGWQMQDGKIEAHTRSALGDMGLEYFDSLLIHWPFPEYLEDTWSKLQRLTEQGLVKQIGICNLRRRNIEALERSGIRPDIIQIERNPLNTMQPEVELSLASGISLQAYSPLCKMDARIKDNPALDAIARKYDKNVGQVVMRWHLDTGVSPVFTSKKASRIAEYSQLAGFALSPEEISVISSLNRNYKMYLESFQCPGL